MDEEERWALEYFKSVKVGDNFDIQKELKCREVISGLLLKQQKEIEELKDFNTKLQATKDRLDIYDKENTLEIEKLKKEIETLKESQFVLYGDDGNIVGCIRLGNDVISKDKIKEKIKELEKKKDWFIKYKTSDEVYNKIEILEELLRG